MNGIINILHEIYTYICFVNKACIYIHKICSPHTCRVCSSIPCKGNAYNQKICCWYDKMHIQFVLVYTEQNIQKSSVLKHSWSKMHKSFYKVHVDFKRRLKVGTNLILHSNFYAQQPGIFQK